MAEKWKLVPLEPTPDMMSAAWDHTPLVMDDMTDGDFGQAYKDMLDAAPSLPVAVQEERDAVAPTRLQIQVMALRLFELDVDEIEAELMSIFSTPHAAMKGDQP